MSLRDYFDDPAAGEWNLDTVGATVVLAMALILFPLRFYVSQFLVHTVPVVIGIASAGYLLLERYGFEDPAIHHWRLSERTGHAVRMTVPVGLAVMILVGTVTGGRTIPFLGLAALVGALVFAQIFFLRRTDLEPTFLLAQVVAFALVVRGIALVTTPGLIGVDSWIHLPEFARSIRQTGQLSAIGGSKYFAAPLYHLLVVVAAEAFNTSLRIALYATLGVVMPLSIVLLYCTSRCFLATRWALFAAAAFGVADHVVRWGIHVIPTSMGLVFFLGVFYGVGKLSATRETPAMYGLVIFFAVATILTHQISTFIVLLFLGAGALAQLYDRFLAPRSHHGAPATGGGDVNFVALLVVVAPLTALDWSIAPPGSGSFLEGMTVSALSSLGTTELLALSSASTVDSATIESMMTTVPLSIQILDALGFLLLLLVTLVGTFALLRRQRLEVLPLAWINSTALMLFVVLGMPLLGLYFLVPMRWYAFLYVPMVVLAAYGMSYLEVNVPARQLVAVMVLFSLLFPGAMLVNHKATHDDPVGEEYYHKFAYSESELAAAQTISTIHPEDATLRADHPYFIFLRDAERVPAEPLELTDRGTVSDDHVVYRSYQAAGGTEVRYEGDSVRTRLSAGEVCRPSMDVLYTNGDVRYCRSSAGGTTT